MRLRTLTLIILSQIFLLFDAVSKQKLVWFDEFNGDSLDYSKWGVEVECIWRR